MPWIPMGQRRDGLRQFEHHAIPPTTPVYPLRASGRVIDGPWDRDAGRSQSVDIRSGRIVPVTAQRQGAVRLDRPQLNRRIGSWVRAGLRLAFAVVRTRGADR